MTKPITTARIPDEVDPDLLDAARLRARELADDPAAGGGADAGAGAGAGAGSAGAPPAGAAQGH
ncbi:MAG: hypothetical protein ACT4RN_14805, partial [Pseudonocardia sp.]